MKRFMAGAGYKIKTIIDRIKRKFGEETMEETYIDIDYADFDLMTIKRSVDWIRAEMSGVRVGSPGEIITTTARALERYEKREMVYRHQTKELLTAVFGMTDDMLDTAGRYRELAERIKKEFNGNGNND